LADDAELSSGDRVRPFAVNDLLACLAPRYEIVGCIVGEYEPDPSGQPGFEQVHADD